MAKLRKIVNQLLALAVTIILIFFVAPFVLLPILLPVYLFRWVVSKTISIFRPDLGKLLSAKSSMFAIDDYLENPKCTLIIPLITKGHLTVEKFRQIFTDKLLQVRLPNGKLKNPELTQYISSWMGFFCWKEDPNFSIENHIKMYSGPIKIPKEISLTEWDLLPKIGSELIHRPFIKERSPWEFHIIHNVRFSEDQKSKGPSIKIKGESPNSTKKEAQTLIIMRTHHAFADGFSILKFLMDLSAHQIESPPLHANKTSKNSSSNKVDAIKIKSNKSKFNKFYKMLKLVIKLAQAPYEIIERFIEISGQDKNSWHLPKDKLARGINTAWTEAIPLDYIKEIRRAHGGQVSTTAVIMAAVTGGLRNFMIDEGMKVPPKIHCLSPVPMPGHPETFDNHFSGCVLTLPLGISQAVRRLEYADREWTTVKKSTIPQTGFIVFTLLGALFPWMARRFRDHTNYTAIFSNFKGPEKIHFAGLPLLWVNFGGGLLPGNIGVGFSTLSYNGRIHLTAGVNQSILPRQDLVQSLVEKIQEEFHILMHCSEDANLKPPGESASVQLLVPGKTNRMAPSSG